MDSTPCGYHSAREVHTSVSHCAGKVVLTMVAIRRAQSYQKYGIRAPCETRTSPGCQSACALTACGIQARMKQTVLLFETLDALHQARVPDGETEKITKVWIIQPRPEAVIYQVRSSRSAMPCGGSTNRANGAWTRFPSPLSAQETREGCTVFFCKSTGLLHGQCEDQFLENVYI
jgi:hypothetical protein